MNRSKHNHLPTSSQECRQRGWQQVDIILVSGDAYIDHPSFGIAIISRLLESHGYRVAILAQPRFDSAEEFKRFGKPRLFYGISAGNLDSIVANYSGSGKVRETDAYSKDGDPWRSKEHSRKNRRRPDRATIVYANLARAAYSDVPVVLGGIEASLRRFVHYDYKQEKLRGSVLADAKADLLLYGMAERAIVAAASAYAGGRPADAIQGSCQRLSDAQFTDFQRRHGEDEIIILPSWHDINGDAKRFMEAELAIDKQARAASNTILAQQQKSGWVIQHPAGPPLTEKELDRLYALPFTRTPHPQAGDIPAYRMICHSVTIVRGCSGNCSFCAITRHQGPRTVSRSEKSILAEIAMIRRMDDFRGTVSDLGGPTANLWATGCNIGGCAKHDCLFPEVCKHLHIDEQRWLDLLNRASELEDVHHIFISSGLRMELLLKTPTLLEKILTEHTPGALKIAPEHTDTTVLQLMHKESHKVLKRFIGWCRKHAQKDGEKVKLSPYVITGHPGSSEKSARRLVEDMHQLGLTVRQFQDFTPTPGTISTAMSVSGIDRNNTPVEIPSPSCRARQRQVLERGFFKKNIRKRKKRNKKRRNPKA